MWTVDQTRILTKGEISRILAELGRKARRSPNTRQNLVLFRLACCCGLRVSELTALRLCDVKVGSDDRPYIQVRKGKGGKDRRVPLWWDRGTLEDLRAFKALRQAQGAANTDWLLTTRDGGRIDRLNARKRFQSCCRLLDRPVTVHDGRHSAVSHWLHAGRSLAEVRDAAGHSNISTTSVYTHLVDDDGTVGNIFG